MCKLLGRKKGDEPAMSKCNKCENQSERMWNSRKQEWVCGNTDSEEYGKRAKDQLGKPDLLDRAISRFIYGGPEKK